jgi:hypothetical protein
MKKTIPDLREAPDEFTAEHCSVLLERLGTALDQTYGDGMSEIASQIDPFEMRDALLDLMPAHRLMQLFRTDVGKNMILGIFYMKFIVPQPTEE